MVYACKKLLIYLEGGAGYSRHIPDTEDALGTFSCSILASNIDKLTHDKYKMRTLSSTALMSPSNRTIAKARLKQILDTYIHHRPTVQRLLTAGFVLYCLGTTYQNLSGKGAKGGTREKISKRGRQGESKRQVELIQDGKKKVSVSDPLFYVRLKKLIRIVIPSIRSREAAMLALHSAFLLLRTGISLYVADLDGR